MRWTGPKEQYRCIVGISCSFCGQCSVCFVMYFGDVFGQDSGFERCWRRTLSWPSRCSPLPSDQYSKCTSSNSDQIIRQFFEPFKMCGNNPSRWLACRMLVGQDILDKDEFGFREFFSGIKFANIVPYSHQKSQPHSERFCQHPVNQASNCHFGRTGWWNGSSLQQHYSQWTWDLRVPTSFFSIYFQLMACYTSLIVCSSYRQTCSRSQLGANCMCPVPCLHPHLLNPMWTAAVVTDTLLPPSW